MSEIHQFGSRCQDLQTAESSFQVDQAGVRVGIGILGNSVGNAVERWHDEVDVIQSMFVYDEPAVDTVDLGRQPTDKRPCLSFVAVEAV